jgi:hypothetical protein
MRFSLLTVAPRSNAVYTIYGHTALRVSLSDGADFVLNWGTFDTDRDNFIFHFVRGETDYFLSAEAYRDFVRHYLASGAEIVEQNLNIPDSLRQHLLQTVIANLQPENSEYRYNYFFDNCTLRPRNLIERFCGGELVYPPLNKKLTLRDLVHSCTAPYPWMQFGIDLVIGSGADSLISRRTSLFLPVELCRTLDSSAVCLPNGELRPIVAASQHIASQRQKADNDESEKATSTPLWTRPVVVCSALFLLSLVIALPRLREIRARWDSRYRDFEKRPAEAVFRLFFGLLFLVAALGGCLVAMLVFFSVHPCVSPNWNIVWLHPLHFIAVIGFIKGDNTGFYSAYHSLNFMVLTVFLLAFFFLPQSFDLANLPIIASLWLGSGAVALMLRRPECQSVTAFQRFIKILHNLINE